MKYSLTATIEIDESTIAKAQKWAKIRGYDYKKDKSSLLFDYLTEGAKDMDVLNTEIEEIKEGK